ncbi:glycosyltransferase family 4 protein [Candidatus Uhrbacteria bacterium]|nr:glycosyltransferase family 4 protein [Candidatus Uhrbacteria bacterium]
MKRTLLVTLDFHPNVGGVASYWRSLSNHLPREQWIVLAPSLPRGWKELEAAYPIFRRNLLVSWLLPRWLPIMFHAAMIARAERISHIVVGQILPVGTAIRILSAVLRIPYTVSTHGMDVTLPLRSYRKRSLARWILRGAQSVITISEYTAHILEQNGVGRERIRFVRPCPVITPALYRDSDQNLHLRTARHILLTVGRLVQRKGVTDVIRALPDLLKEFPDLIYGIIGEGPELHSIQLAIDELSLNHRVYLLGELDNEKIAWWYRHCTLFIMTPKEINGDVEGFGIVYLEAGSFGKPVIGSRSGGVLDAVLDGETGVLVPPANSHAIAGAIRTLLHGDAARTKLGEQGRARVEKDFQWKVQAEKLKRYLSD